MIGAIDQAESETSKRKREEPNEKISGTELLVDQLDQSATITHDNTVLSDANEDEGVEPVKKKKKQFVGKTNFVNNDEFEDILESGWFYLDSSDKPQGPFSSREMKQWYMAGFFFETTMVKRINEEEFVPISACDEFKNCDLSAAVVSTDIYSMNNAVSIGEYGDQSMQYNYGDQSMYNQNYNYGATHQSNYNYNTQYDEPTHVGYNQPVVSGNYAQSAYFNSHSGKFAPVSNHFAAKGLAEDKAGRMLSHFLDMDSYQESMRAAKNSESEGKVKVTKKMANAFKKKKIDKQRRRILMM